MPMHPIVMARLIDTMHDDTVDEMLRIIDAVKECTHYLDQETTELQTKLLKEKIVRTSGED